MAALNSHHLSPSRFKVDGIVAGSDGREYVIAGIHTKAKQVMLLGPLGETYVYDADDFRNKVAAGDLMLVACKRNADGVEEIFEPRQLVPSERKALDERKQYIDIVLKHIDNGTWDYIYEQIKLECSGRKIPSRRTIERIWRIYKDSLSLSCLAPNYSKRGRHHSLLLNPYVEDIIINELEATYCNSSSFSIEGIVIRINQKCDKKSAEVGLDLGGVSRRTVGRFIGRLNIGKLKGRLTQKSFRMIMRNAYRYFDVKEPYARVELDSTVLDILIVDLDGNVIGSPTLYGMIDVATQTIVGIYLTIQAASQVGILQTLKFAFSPKGESFQREHKCIHPWPAPADIHTIVMDNGADCHGPMVVRAARHLSIMLEYCTAGAPYQKPFVERFFGTLHTQLIKALPGAKYSQDKREMHALERAEKTASLTLDQLYGFIIRWVTDTYHIHISERLSDKFNRGCSPIKALEILSQQYVVFPAPSIEELDFACRHHLEVSIKVTRDGLNYQGQQYQSTYVSGLYKTNSVQRVDVCVNPLDCSAIHIYDRDSGVWVEVPNKSPYMSAMSFEQAKFYRKKRYKTDLEISRSEHVLNQQKIIEDAHASKRKKGSVNKNRKAERAMERAEAAIEMAFEKPVAELPLGSSDFIHAAGTPYRRKK